jgi:predicted oxidoreductase (fatty acid repression mutant protein)
MKPYAITLSVVAVVMADDESHARQVAENERREIFGDAYGKVLQFSDATEVKTLAELTRVHYDGVCLPYGGDGETRLQDILAGVAP